MPATVFHSGPRRGQRCSAAAAYLPPDVRARPNLTLRTNALVEQIVVDEHGSRAAGVRLRSGQSGAETVLARREVILSAGAIQTPQLLQVSGIGDAAHLASIGVPQVILDRPEVGRNLQDHLEFYLQYECKLPVSIQPKLHPLRKLGIGIEWLLTRRGLGASNHFEAGAFLRSQAGVKYPDIQFHFLPVAVSYDGKTAADSPTGHSFQLHVGTMRSPARGHVLAQSRDMAVAPEIDFRYMSAPSDWADMRRALRLAREVLAQPAMAELAGAELSPGLGVESDADIDAWLAQHLESAYHPCGTVRMGSDAAAPADLGGRLKGLEGLRVCDASLFPRVTNGNLNGPVIAVAERISDLILHDAGGPPPLPPASVHDSAALYESGWRSQQRKAAPKIKTWFNE